MSNPNDDPVAIIERLLTLLFTRRVIVDEKYMIRWHLIPHNRWCNVMLHKFNGPDPGRDLHDHPWSFLTLILRGRYVELIPVWQAWDTDNELCGAFVQARCYLRRWSVSWRPAEYIHAVERIEPNTWSLVVTGPYRREWGFHTKSGFVRHDQYEGSE